MPRFIGHYVGISFQAELLAMTLLGLLNSTLEWYPFDWTHQVQKIWELSLSQHYFHFYTDFEYWIKTILTWIVITRKIVAYIYTFLYTVNFYPILTWSRPNLLLPWLILSFLQNFILKSIVIMIFLWLWNGERFSFIRTIEFILVEFLSLITSAYIWYALACSYIQLKRIEKIRRMRKNLQTKYSIGYDLFSSDSSSMAISNESSYGSFLGGRRHMSLPNLNEAFYRSIFSDTYNDNKISRSLTTLSTINSFSDSEGFISQIVHNNDLMPAEKCMRMLGITDVDVINARMRAQKQLLASCSRTDIGNRTEARSFEFDEARRPRKDETEKIRTIKSREIKSPSMVDYLMARTSIPETVFHTHDIPDEMTLKKVDRKENYLTREQERANEYFTPDTERGDKKTEKSSIQTEKRQIVEPEKKFIRPPLAEFVTDRTDKREETKLQFVKKKKQKKVCPLMREFIESRPCFPLVGRRKFKECPFKKDTLPSCSPSSCISARKDKHLNNANFIETDTTGFQAESNKDTSSKDVPEDESTVVEHDESKLENDFVQSESSKNVITIQDLTNKGSENDLTLKQSREIDTFGLSKELRLEPRRNFNHIFNNRSNVLPLANVWSTIGCLPFRQKFNFTSLYGRELQFDKSLFKPSSSQELLDRGRLIAWNPSSTELLVKVPEQVVCYTGIEYKPVPIPGTSNGARYVQDKLLRLGCVDQDSVKMNSYTNNEYHASKGKFEDDNSFYVSQNVLTERRNFIEDSDACNDRKTTSTQTTESIDNYNYDIACISANTISYDTYDTERLYPKFVSKISTTNSLNHTFNTNDEFKNDSYSNISREDSIENESCCCKDSRPQLTHESANTNLLQVVHSSEYEKSSYSNKPPAYPKKTKKKSLHRLTGVKNKIVKVSFESNKHLEHFDRLRHDIESSRRRKRLSSSMEREQLEMKALRAYNEITLFEDKREMGEKTRRMTETIYSFMDDTKVLKLQTDSRLKMQNKRQVQEKNENEDSSNEIEIANTANSFFEYIASFNNEKVLTDKDVINPPRLPNIKSKDAEIMLNLLNRHGSQWFKQELERILTKKASQVNVKHSEPSHYALKLDEFLTSCQKIDDFCDGSKLERSRGEANISIPSQVPLSYNYLQTRSGLDANRNVTNETRDTMILNSMESIISEVPTNSIDLKDLTECTENNEIKEEREIRTTNLSKEDKSMDTEITKNITTIEMNNISHLPTNNPIPLSSCARTHEDAMESIDTSNHHEEVRRRNMSLHMMNIARNIGWTLRPNGIVLTNKNLQGQSLESTNHRGSQQRDIIDDTTASLVHGAFSHKPEIIIRTFTHDSRSTTDQGNADERSALIFDDIYNTYRLMATIDEFVLRADNEVSISMGDTLSLPDDQEPEIEANNNLDDSLPSSYDSMETERNFNVCIVVMENDEVSLESISTSTDSLPDDEVVEHDSVEVVPRSSEIRKMDVTDPRIDSSEEEAMKDSQQPSLEMIIAFFSFLLACYSQYMISYLFSISDSASSFYTYRPCEVHSDSAFKKNFLEKSLSRSNSASNANVSVLVARSENGEGIGVIEFTDEAANDDGIGVIEFTDEAANDDGIGVIEFTDEAANDDGNGVIEFTDEAANDDEVSVESTDQQTSNLRDSFDTTYSRSTDESESAISVGDASSLEEFS